MFKKYLVFFFVLTLSLFLNNKVNAFTLPTNSCQQANYTASPYVITQADLTGDINICVKDSNVGQALNIFKDNVNGQPIYTITADGNNQIVSYATTFMVSELNVQKIFQFVVSDAQSGQANAEYKITLIPAPIIMHNDYNPEIQNGGNVATGTPVRFTCSSSTDMYFDGVLKDSYSWYNHTPLYTLSYLFPNNDPVPTQHTVICKNIGGTINQNVFVFNTVSGAANNMTGTISAPDCTIAINGSSCSSTITWSTTNPVSTSAVTSETDGTGTSSPNNNISNGNNGSRSVTIPYLVLGSHQGRNFYLYNNAIQLAQDTATANCAAGSTWDGTKCKQDPSCPPPIGGTLVNGVCTCPTGQNNINGTCGTCPTGTTYSNGSCVPNPSCTGGTISNGVCTCPTGSTYSNGSCTSGSSCPPGLYMVNSVCTACPYGYNSTTHTCRTQSANNDTPTCSFTDGTYNFVSCTNIPTCSNGNPAELHVYTSTGGDQTILPPYTFNWNPTQYQYSFICPGNTVVQQSLRRPYTHFINFNVSAGYIKKGSGINLSWIVQDPTTTCKIIATDINTGNVLFDTSSTSSNTYTRINKSLTTSSSTTQINRISNNNYKALMGAFYTVNQSTRFTASCINPVNDLHYMEGLNKLVRDVYLTSESER